MNAMKLNAICLKLFYSTLFQSVFKILASRRRWWREDQGAKDWFCFLLLFLLYFLLKIVLWECVCPWQRRDYCSIGSIRCLIAKMYTQCSAEILISQTANAVMEQRLQGSCEHKAPLQCMRVQNQPPRWGKSSTQLTPDCWCWGKRTLSLSTVAGLTFTEGNPGLIFMAFFYS